MTVAVGERAGCRSTPQHIIETAATAASGAALAGTAWSLVDLEVVAVVIGAANGAISGARRIYRWRSASGWLAFVFDSTWALITTAAGLFAHAVAARQRSPRNYVDDLSRRRNRHVYERGYTLRRGFMLTVGNVVSGAGPAVRRRPHRQRVVEHHEHVHVWQARWFGPLFPALYGVWWVLGALAAAVVWVVRRPPAGIRRVVDSLAYYCNPFEWWAYSREGRWPPPQALDRFVWRRPLTKKS